MRQRKRDRHLPPCVYQHHGAYWLVKRNRWTRLGTSLPEALAEYGRQIRPPQAGSMATLIHDALDAKRPKLAKNTWAQYQVVARKLASILAEFNPHDVLPRHLAEIRQAMQDTPNMANRLLSVARLVFDYALERGLVDSNPATGIKRLEEAQRKAMPTDDEVNAIRAKSPPRLQVIIDLLVLTGQRVGDVLALRRSDLTDEGIAFTQQKTGARIIVLWSPELRAAVERAKALHGNIRALTLLHNRRGKPPDYRTTYQQWQLACERAGVSDAHLHDLRAYALTRAQQEGLDPTALAGHTSAAMTKRYLRAKEIPLVSGPSLSRLFAEQKKRQ